MNKRILALLLAALLTASSMTACGGGEGTGNTTDPAAETTSADTVPEETEIRDGKPAVTGKICVIGSGLKQDALEALFKA